MFRHLNGAGSEDQPKKRLTAVRREVKYLLEPQEAAAALKDFREHVPPKVIDGSFRNWRVSVYLDGPGRDLARAELEAKKRSIKLRVKDYYLLDGGAPVFSDNCWLEVKVRLGAIVEKSRLSVDRQAVAHALIHGPGPIEDTKDQAALEAFEDVRGGNSLTPLFVVHYRRATLQDPESNMRVTFDDQVTYHMPPISLFTENPCCTRRDLPPPVRVEPKWVLEIKSLGSPPAFVDEIVSPERQVDYSKFRTGVKELHKRGLIEPTRKGDE